MEIADARQQCIIFEKNDTLKQNKETIERRMEGFVRGIAMDQKKKHIKEMFQTSTKREKQELWKTIEKQLERIQQKREERKRKEGEKMIKSTEYYDDMKIEEIYIDGITYIGHQYIESMAVRGDRVKEELRKIEKQQEFIKVVKRLHDMMEVNTDNLVGNVNINEKIAVLCQEIYLKFSGQYALQQRKMKEAEEEREIELFFENEKGNNKKKEAWRANILEEDEELIAMTSKEERAIKDMLPNMIIFYMNKAMGQKARVMDIKRLGQIERALLMISKKVKEQEIGEYVRSMMKHERMTSHKKGKEFVVFCMSHSNALMNVMIASMMQQIPLAKETQQINYGEILFKTYKTTTTKEGKRNVEEVLQRIVHAMIHAKQKSTFEALNRIMQTFHHDKYKKDDDIANLLFRTYQPILFRSCSVTNALVRRQSSQMFIELFPLRTTNEAEDMEELIERQIALLETIMDDDVPSVRCVGIQGAGQLLTLYWDIFHEKRRYKIIKKIANKYILDTASTAVRLSSIKACEMMLDQHAAHPILHQFLKKGTIGKLIHDSASQIRTAILTLLNRVTSVRNVSPLDIVNEADIMRRLVVDPRIQQLEIAELLYNTYFNMKLPKSEMFLRAVSFVEKHPQAAIAFYECVGAKDTVNDIRGINKFLKTLLKFLSLCITIRQQGQLVEEEDEPTGSPTKKKKKQQPTRKKSQPQENVEENQVLEKQAHNIVLIENLVGVLSAMATTAHETLTDEVQSGDLSSEDYEQAVTKLKNTFKDKFEFFQDLQQVYAHPYVLKHIWKMTPILPESIAQPMKLNALTKFELLCRAQTLDDTAFDIMKALDQWNQFPSVVETLLNLLRGESTIYSKTLQSEDGPSKKRMLSKEIAPEQLYCIQNSLYLTKQLLQDDFMKEKVNERIPEFVDALAPRIYSNFLYDMAESGNVIGSLCLFVYCHLLLLSNQDASLTIQKLCQYTFQDDNLFIHLAGIQEDVSTQQKRKRDGTVVEIQGQSMANELITSYYHTMLSLVTDLILFNKFPMDQLDGYLDTIFLNSPVNKSIQQATLGSHLKLLVHCFSLIPDHRLLQLSYGFFASLINEQNECELHPTLMRRFMTALSKQHLDYAFIDKIIGLPTQQDLTQDNTSLQFNVAKLMLPLLGDRYCSSTMQLIMTMIDRRLREIEMYKNFETSPKDNQEKEKDTINHLLNLLTVYSIDSLKSVNQFDTIQHALYEYSKQWAIDDDILHYFMPSNSCNA